MCDIIMDMKKIAVVISALVLAVFTTTGVSAEISEETKNTITEKCDSIKETLVNVQHDDSRVRVYLGRYYEAILNKFITPLNVKLVEKNMSNTNFINSQNNFVKMRTNFIIDYIEYQKALESLVAMDCKTEPEKFYSELEEVRIKRSLVAEDTAKLRSLANEQVELVTKLRGTL